MLTSGSDDKQILSSYQTLLRWVWAASILTVVAPLTFGITLVLSDSAHKSRGISWLIVGASIHLFLLWKVMERRNWARRLIIVSTVIALPFTPLLLFVPAFYQILYSSFDLLNSAARFMAIADMLCGFILVGYLFTPRMRLLFTKDAPSAFLRIVLGLSAFCGLAIGVFLWIGVATLGKAVTFQHGHAVLTQRGELIFQTMSQKGHIKAEELIGTKLPYWGYLLNGVAFDGINIVLYVNWNPLEYFLIFETPKNKELTLDQMLQALEQYVQRAKKSTHRLWWRRPDQEVSAKITVVGQKQLVLKSGDLLAEQIKMTKSGKDLLALKAIVTKGDKRFTIIGGTLSGMMAETHFVDFIEQLESPTRTAESTNAHIVWGKAQRTKPELLNHVRIIAIVNITKTQPYQSEPGGPITGACWRRSDMTIERIIKGKGLGNDQVVEGGEIVCNEISQIPPGRFFVFRDDDISIKMKQIKGGPIVVDEYANLTNNGVKQATFLPIWQDQVPWYTDDKSTDLVWTPFADVLKQIQR